MEAEGSLGATSLCKAVLGQQAPIISSVKHLQFDLRIDFPESPDLSILLRHQALLERGQFNEEVKVNQIEVRREGFGRIARLIPGKRKCLGFILPSNLVEIQDLRKLFLAG